MTFTDAYATFLYQISCEEKAEKKEEEEEEKFGEDGEFDDEEEAEDDEILLLRYGNMERLRIEKLRMEDDKIKLRIKN